MRGLLSRLAILLLAAAGCGGTGPDDSVLTAVEVSPAEAALFTTAPGNTVALTVVGKDQRGEIMTGIGSATFGSDDAAVATVGGDGSVTAVGAGTTQVTASLTAGGVTVEGTTAVSVQAAPIHATVRAPEFAFQPQTVDVNAGGSVAWIIGAIHHTIAFTDVGAPDDIPELRNETAQRTFPSQGTFGYRCEIHPAMIGTVRVH
jgi:plastocyanin